MIAKIFIRKTVNSIYVANLMFLLFLTSTVIADVRLPAIIGDNMVLQQKTDSNVLGWEDPGEKIQVKASW